MVGRAAIPITLSSDVNRSTARPNRYTLQRGNRVLHPPFPASLRNSQIAETPSFLDSSISTVSAELAELANASEL
jgi:hypothetical protein